MKFLTPLFFIVFLMPKSSYGQQHLIKAGAFFFPNSVYDLGFETKIAKKWTGQVSFTKSSDLFSEYSDSDKHLWAFQVRHYLKSNWANSLYSGLVVQKYSKDEKIYYVTHPELSTATSVDKRWGGGLIVGYQFKIFRRLGLDIHGGLIAQRGKKETTEVYKVTKPNSVENETITFKLHPFWGVNLYMALGKMFVSDTDKKSKSEN